ncbi:MAG: hypothetical protein ACOYKZ_07810 [Chlamydiia bacterium]
MQDVTSPNKSYGATGLIGPPEDMKQWNAAIAQGDYGLLATPKAEDPSEKPSYCRGLSVSRVGDYRCISHGGELGGAVVIYRRYENRDDPTKTFAFFLATNADNVPHAELTAAGIANEMAGTEVDPGPSPPTGEPSAHNREEDVKDLTGRYRCREFGTEWDVTAVEQSPGSWGLHLEIVGGQFTSQFDFVPKIDGSGKLFQHVTFGGGVLELTDKGLIFSSEKMAPVHFERLG